MAKQIIKRVLNKGGLELRRYDKQLNYYRKLYLKFKDFTMIPQEAFILNLELCGKFKHLKGDYVECGVWRGGMSAAIAEILGSDRRIHLFDSFEGLPPAAEIDGKEALEWQSNVESPSYHSNCAAEEIFVKDAMVLAQHTNYITYKGWFDQTLAEFAGEHISLLRLDGDWYDSILVCLQQLFPKVIEGGIVILDDYYTWDGCAKAVHDYLSEIKSPSRVYQFNNQIGYIVKKND